MSDTPRTDAALEKDGSDVLRMSWADYVKADFARQLERELKGARTLVKIHEALDFATESPVFLPIAISLLNTVKAWRDCDGNDGFPHETREKIDALLTAYELVQQGTYAERTRGSNG